MNPAVVLSTLPASNNLFATNFLVIAYLYMDW